VQIQRYQRALQTPRAFLTCGRRWVVLNQLGDVAQDVRIGAQVADATVLVAALEPFLGNGRFQGQVTNASLWHYGISPATRHGAPKFNTGLEAIRCLDNRNGVHVSDAWKAYWPIYERLEQELCRLSFSVAFCDAHLTVYSQNLADLLLRTCSECENAGKSLCSDKGLVSKGVDVAQMNFPAVANAITTRLSDMSVKQVAIIWPYHSFTIASVRPFDNWNGTSNSNPKWFNAYNSVKHDRIAHAADANLGNVINALAGLFVLNMWLRESDIVRDAHDANVAKTIVNSYSRLFSPASFLQPARADGISVSGGASTRLRNLEFAW
jgi:hypothetical protein